MRYTCTRSFSSLFMDRIYIYIFKAIRWTFNNRDVVLRLRRWTCNLEALPRWGFESYRGQDFCNVHLFRVLCSWTGSVQMKSSMTFIRGNRCTEKDDFKNDGEVKRLKECALALKYQGIDYICFSFHHNMNWQKSIEYRAFLDRIEATMIYDRRCFTGCATCVAGTYIFVILIYNDKQSTNSLLGIPLIRSVVT